MALRLDQLGRPATLPDRLADASQPAAVDSVLGNEVPPRRDDSRWVDPNVVHVGEEHSLRIPAKVRPQHVDLLGTDDNQRRLVIGEAIADEGAGTCDEVVITGVEEGLVAEGGVDAHA